MTIDQQTLQGNWNEIKGKLRNRWGDLSNDELESAQGNVEQLVGTIQRKTGEARDAVETYLEELTRSGASAIGRAAETVRQSAQHATRQAADAVAAGYSKTHDLVQHRPIESLAACFGVGLITGLAVGVLLRSR